MGATNIEWTDAVWNPVTGCTKVSEGCRNCFAEGVAKRFWGKRKFTDVQRHEDRLTDPLRWCKPRRVFVNSMSDLFHEDVPDEFIARVFQHMGMARQHTFQVLTKRPERMQRLLSGVLGRWRDAGPVHVMTFDDAGSPLPNVWLGVSCEDQESADERIPLLLQTPAAVRFVSCEPLLGPIDLLQVPFRGHPKNANDGSALFIGDEGGSDFSWTRRGMMHWIIVGGESGPGARTCEVGWIRGIVEQCTAASVPCFVKQIGARPVARDRWDMTEAQFVGADASGWDEASGPVCLRMFRDRKGGDPSEWPADLRVRQFPEVRP